MKKYLRFPFPFLPAHPLTRSFDIMKIHKSDDEIGVQDDKPQCYDQNSNKPRYIASVLEEGQIAVGSGRSGGGGDRWNH